MEEKKMKTIKTKSQKSLDLKTENWIKGVLTNDEVSTDCELIEYFCENGLTKEQATQWVLQRNKYYNVI
jgi:hypothetical protein